jgi:hypothetical protein
MPTILGLRNTVLLAVITIAICVTAASAQISSDENLPSGKKSDGCTLIADGDIHDCCVAHDQEYFRGGTRKERRASDKKLYECVCRKGGWNRVFAPFIWLGVRIGGLPFLPTSFRWGFGTKEKGYAKPRAAVKPVVNDP